MHSTYTLWRGIFDLFWSDGGVDTEKFAKFFFVGQKIVPALFRMEHTVHSHVHEMCGSYYWCLIVFKPCKKHKNKNKNKNNQFNVFFMSSSLCCLRVWHSNKIWMNERRSNNDSYDMWDQIPKIACRHLLTSIWIRWCLLNDSYRYDIFIYTIHLSIYCCMKYDV